MSDSSFTSLLAKRNRNQVRDSEDEDEQLPSSSKKAKLDTNDNDDRILFPEATGEEGANYSSDDDDAAEESDDDQKVEENHDHTDNDNDEVAEGTDTLATTSTSSLSPPPDPTMPPSDDKDVPSPAASSNSSSSQYKQDDDDDEDWQSATAEMLKKQSEMEAKQAQSSSNAEPEEIDYGPAAKMMRKMGYQKGKGLGATQQGRAEPVALSTQHGRKGLGTEKGKLDMDREATWDPSVEELTVHEKVRWMTPCSLPIPKFKDMTGWIKEGPKRMDITKETEFCSAETIEEMVKAKDVFEELSNRELHNARQRANPYETVKGAIFQNRAAMKMANLDAVFDDLFTNPVQPHAPEDSPSPSKWVPCDPKHKEVFYFADVCAGPGGFSEYVLWRRGYHCHGFGFTLRGKDDFKLENFLSGCPEFFDAYYGARDDGDVTKPTNLEDLTGVVMAGTERQGVHLFMADGGFSVEGQENIQEILSKRLYLCQIGCALNILRTGGNFVCKLFDVFTPFSVGLVYLMYRVFDRVCLHKPHTSRPANSERYLIGQGLKDRQSVQSVANYLLKKVNKRLDEMSADPEMKDLDILEIVPMDVLKGDTHFYQYVNSSNEFLAKRQTIYLDKYRVFAKNPNLFDSKQADLRTQCLEFWKVPDGRKPEMMRGGPQHRFTELTGLHNESMLINGKARPYPDSVKEDLMVAVDKCSIAGLHYVCVPLTYRDEPPKIYMGLGRIHTYAFSASPNRMNWEQKIEVRLPKGTLIYAELTLLHRGEGTGRLSNYVLRVIDAYMLAGENVYDQPWEIRQSAIVKFCTALSRAHNPNRIPGYIVIRPAESFRLCHLPLWISKARISLSEKSNDIKLMDQMPQTNVKPQYFHCRGLAFFAPSKTDREQRWMTRWSRSAKQVFYFNPRDNHKHFQSETHLPLNQSAWADFRTMIGSQIDWMWRNVEREKMLAVFAKPEADDGATGGDLDGDLKSIHGLMKHVLKQMIDTNAGELVDDLNRQLDERP